MNIDLEQILGSNLVPDSTLQSAAHLLKESLPSCRRDLAYVLANIRRTEQKYKQPREEVSRQDRDLELAKSQNDPGRIQSISSDRSNNIQVMKKLEIEYQDLTQKAQTLKDKISATESHILKIEAKRKNLKTQTQTAQRRKYYYMALGVIDPDFLINVIEYPVIQESISQHSQLTVDVRIKFKPIEIAAYALNRLPSVYVATISEYNHHLRNILSEKEKISDAVKRSIHALRMGDPLHDSTPLPEELFCEPRGLLGRLSVLFNRNDLRWTEVPKLLLKLKEQRSPSQSISNPQPYASSYVRQNQFTHVQKYLQRSNLRKNNYEFGEEKFGSGSHSKSKQIEDKFLEMYTLRFKFKFVNVIEKLVLVQALFMMIDIFDEATWSNEILCQALNQNQGMYTTSERGLKRFCQQFFENHARSINVQIAKSIKLRDFTSKSSDPIYFKQFNLEYQTALHEIGKIVERQDLSPENLVGIIEQFVKQ